MSTFRKAVKAESKLRLALAGPAGSGKTFTALTLAMYLADGAPVAVIDTERGSASKYADIFPFDVLELDTFHPDRYVEAIRAAAAEGYAVVVIDSLSHAWNGTDGLLELVEKTAKQRGINSFQAWGAVKPIENRLVEAITGASIHVIATMRSKTEYVVEQNERGKATPRKVGTAPVQRDGFEYEFDVFGEMTADNELIVQKTRCPALAGAVISKPGKPLAATLREWLAGVPAPTKPAPDANPTPAPVLTPHGWDHVKKLADDLGLSAAERGKLNREHHQDAEAIYKALEARIAAKREKAEAEITFTVAEPDAEAAGDPDLVELPVGARGN